MLILHQVIFLYTLLAIVGLILVVKLQTFGAVVLHLVPQILLLNKIVSWGGSGMLKPLMLQSNCKRDTFAWKREETTVSPAQLMALNGLTAENLVKRALELVG
jgi:hypothetical protein